MQPEARILLVEDDPAQREIVAAYLGQRGFEVAVAADGASARRLFNLAPVDLVLADINLPDGSGQELARDLQRQRPCAVIFTTSRGGAADRIAGLEAGGDDYLVKPLDLGELAARVRAVLRRTRGRAPDRVVVPVVALGDWTLDLVRRELASGGGALVRLTRAEFDLFAALAQAGDRPLGRDYLVEVVASAEAATRARTIDVMVSRIRRKLADAGQGAPGIDTVQGEGYRLARFDSAARTAP